LPRRSRGGGAGARRELRPRRDPADPPGGDAGDADGGALPALRPGLQGGAAGGHAAGFAVRDEPASCCSGRPSMPPGRGCSARSPWRGAPSSSSSPTATSRPPTTPPSAPCAPASPSERVTGGFRTHEGAAFYADARSLPETTRRRSIPPLQAITLSLQRHPLPIQSA
jgi:hypothetical protein